MKQYKIVRIAPLNVNSFLINFYAKNPDLKFQSYHEQQEAIFKKKYSYSNGFSEGMKKLGRDAHEIIYDQEDLQKTWARENNISYNSDHWQHEIIIKQIEQMRPDVVYFQDIHSLPYSIRKTLKKDFSFVKLVVVYKGYPGTFNELGDVDLLLTATPRMVALFSEAGLNPRLVYHAFDDAVLEAMNNVCDIKQVHEYDFTFVGSCGFGNALNHQKRYWGLVELIKKTDIQLWTNEIAEGSASWGPFKARSRNLLKQTIANCDVNTLERLKYLNVMSTRIRNLITETIEDKSKPSKQITKLPIKPLGKLYSHRCKPAVFGLDMFDVLKQSKITLNIHTDKAYDCVGNIRLFEATGIGTCLLTDTGKNMVDLFEEGREVVTYSSIDECIEKMKYLLTHEGVRSQIASAGQKRTLADHTVLRRCQQIDDMIQKKL